MSSVIRIKPYFYIHVLDNNSNVTKVEVGPMTFTRQEHQTVVAGPNPMVMIPPRHYAIIKNPVKRNAKGEAQVTASGQVCLSHGDEEIRFEQQPFPLYPGEVLANNRVVPLQVVKADVALRLKCLRNFDKRVAGDEWLFRGPATYMPRIEVQIVAQVNSIVVNENQALRLRATKRCVDASGATREAGEEWLHRTVGAYLPEVDEEVIGIVKAYVLTEKKALHLRATRTFTDTFGKVRKAGTEWLVTISDSETHIPDVYEQVIGEVSITTLTNRQYCIIMDPWKNGEQLFGRKELRKGEASFFLQPGERLESGIQAVYVLGEEEGLLITALEDHVDGKTKHVAGDRWMLHGPCDYVPPVTVQVLEKRKAIPLDENEGIYVRDITSGEVRAVMGQSYMLKPKEELWAKSLPSHVEELLSRTASRDSKEVASTKIRDPSRLVTFRAPHNSAVQVYDYKKKKARVVFGPDLVMLAPDEQFTVLSLSGGIPKQANKIRGLSLLLGPDFMTDMIVVETSDHARLSLKMSYNWEFQVNKDDEDEAQAVFSVPDFVGDLCKALGSRIRAAVARSTFDSFHKSSAQIIREAVFAKDDNGNSLNVLFFPTNRLAVTNIDIQSVEPVDQRTRDALQKSVQMAIEITTNSQEAAARHEAERAEQEARGRLERQKIKDEAAAEASRKSLLELQAQSAAVESTGQATAEAKARAESAYIEGCANVKQSQLRADAETIAARAELEDLTKRHEQEIAHKRAMIDMEINKARSLADIEAKKFSEIVEAIGADTIQSIARAGPEMQAKLLKGLGLKSFMITDGNSPINLFNTAKGMVGGGEPSQEL